jgi:hypothetical protein
MNTDETPGEERSEIDDLAEVIRLQAEALARISGRMAGHMPGPSDRAARKDALPAVRPERRAQVPALADVPALSEESLPVLNAFKKFLEAERRRARIRLLLVSLLFVVLLAGVLVGALWLGRAHMDGVSLELKRQQEQAAQVKADAEAEMKRLAAEAQAAAQTALVLRRDLTNTVLSTRSNLTAQLGNRDAELERLKDSLVSLQLENAGLSRTLNTLMSHVTVQPQPPESSGDNRAPAASPQGSNAVPARLTDPAHASQPLLISAPNLRQPVQFRLPPSP